MDKTHNPELKSWVESANGHPDFPIQNLPFGVFRTSEGQEPTRVGVAIGDMVLDVSAVVREDLFEGDALRAAELCARPTLNALMGLRTTQWTALRARLSELLATAAGDEDVEAIKPCLIPMDSCQMRLPADIGDYTDFYASVFHATNVGSMFRPDNPLLPNYKHIPVGYHGRASSIVVSDSPVRRPLGQTNPDDAAQPTFGASRLLDYELEVGFFVGTGNQHGKPVPIDKARDHIFGLCLVNDWSARDVQKWEYQPLGPFLAKSFVTTISPWVVTMDALEPFRVPAFERDATDPSPLPYLVNDEDKATGGLDLSLEVSIASQQMLERGMSPLRVSRGSFTSMYWTLAQMLAHHASNGCNLRPGDLMASGTVSGPDKGSRGCLLELTWRGSDPVQLPTGEERKFLQDGDEVTITGYCERDGAVRIGMGTCRGTVVAAPTTWAE